MKRVLFLLVAAACKRSSTEAPKEDPRQDPTLAAPSAPGAVDRWKLNIAEPHWSPTRKTLWFGAMTGVCEFGPDAAGNALAKLTCTPLPQTLHTNYVYFGTASDGAPLPVLDDAALDMHVRLLGAEAVVATSTFGHNVHAWSRDAFDIVTTDSPGLVFERHRGGMVAKTPIPVDLAPERVVLGGGMLYYVEQRGAERHLRALAFDRDAPIAPASAADLGVVKEFHDEYPRTCDTLHRHAVAFDGKLAVAVDGAWGPAQPYDSDLPVSCDDRDGVTGFELGSEDVIRVRCATAAACARASVSTVPHHLKIASVGDWVIAVEDRGKRGVNTVIAPIDRHAYNNTEPQVLAPDPETAEWAIFGGSGAAIIAVTVHDTERHFWRVDDKGALTKLE